MQNLNVYNGSLVVNSIIITNYAYFRMSAGQRLFSSYFSRKNIDPNIFFVEYKIRIEPGEKVCKNFQQTLLDYFLFLRRMFDTCKQYATDHIYAKSVNLFVEFNS